MRFILDSQDWAFLLYSLRLTIPIVLGIYLAVRVLNKIKFGKRLTATVLKYQTALLRLSRRYFRGAKHELREGELYE